MTDRRDLKRRVRERQARTGESYMTALRHVLSQREPSEATEPSEASDDAPEPREPSMLVIEMVDLSGVGASLGIQCRVVMAPSLAERVDPNAMLVQLRDALITTEKDPSLALMRDVVLAGEQPRPSDEALRDSRDPDFVARVRAGIGGVSNNGQMLALSVAGKRSAELVVFMLSLVPARFTYIHRPPMLLVSPADNFSGEHARLEAAGLNVLSRVVSR